MDWTPIGERMLEHGIPVLLSIRETTGARRVIRATYFGRFEEVAGHEWDDAGEYDEKTDEHYVPEGWYESNCFDETNWFVHAIAEAWMPLPKPYEPTDG